MERPTKSREFSLSTILERRTLRGVWAYAAWLALYSVTALGFASEIMFHAGAGIAQLLPLLIPVAIVVFQISRPTILGWALIFAPTVLYLGYGVLIAVDNNIGPHPQWQYNSGALLTGSVYLGLLLAVCVGLARSAWPTREPLLVSPLTSAST